MHRNVNNSIFNDTFNIQTFIQCSIIHSMFNHSFNIQTYIQCSIIHSMFNNTFNIQTFIQYSNIHSIFKHSFNIQTYIQCSIMHSMFNNTFHIQTYTFNIQSHIQYSNKYSNIHSSTRTDKRGVLGTTLGVFPPNIGCTKSRYSKLFFFTFFSYILRNFGGFSEIFQLFSLKCGHSTKTTLF